jgi:hypothetical protein
MKWLRTIILFDKGSIVQSPDWISVHESYVRAINSIDYPIGSGTLTLRQKRRLPNGQWQRNGVGFLRKRFLDFMINSENWQCEGSVALARDRDQTPLLLYPSMESYCEPITSDFGEFDFMTTTEHGTRIAIEWETGNISSSHRSMNKLAIALSNEIINIGVLIIPSRALYKHLTDRIGNIGELSGYLAMWADLSSAVTRGLLAITVVEHDNSTSDQDLPYLSVGIDGRSRDRQTKL